MKGGKVSAVVTANVYQDEVLRFLGGPRAFFFAMDEDLPGCDDPRPHVFRSPEGASVREKLKRFLIISRGKKPEE